MRAIYHSQYHMHNLWVAKTHADKTVDLVNDDGALVYAKVAVSSKPETGKCTVVADVVKPGETSNS
jgi:hypothetical protein